MKERVRIADVLMYFPTTYIEKNIFVFPWKVSGCDFLIISGHILQTKEKSLCAVKSKCLCLF